MTDDDRSLSNHLFPKLMNKCSCYSIEDCQYEQGDRSTAVMDRGKPDQTMLEYKGRQRCLMLRKTDDVFFIDHRA